MTTDLPPELQESASDHAAKFLKVVSSPFPFVGAFFGEVMTSVIPGQRLDRIADYLHRLSRRFRDSQSTVEGLQQSMNEIRLEVLELGAFAAARSISPERREQISAAVFNGITADERAARNAAWVLRLMQDLSEDDIALLCAYAPSIRDRPGWLDLHPGIAGLLRADESQMARSGPPSEKPALSTELMMVNLQRLRLVSLGLIRSDQMGMQVMPGHPMDLTYRYDLSPIGILVLEMLEIVRSAR